MARAIIAGLVRTGTPGDDILVVNPNNPTSCGEVHALYGTVTAPAEAVAEAGTVVIAVKPQSFAAACPVYAPHVKPGTLVVSIMAGIPTAAVEAAFPGAREWTVEAGRPDSITMEKLRAIRERGVERVCVNPQTFSDETLRRIGRAHSAQDTLRAFALAREAGFAHINMDVIAALPGEDLPQFRATIEQVLALDPESVTVHSLAIKRSSRLHEELVTEKSDYAAPESAAEMIRFARESLRGHGYFPYYLYRQKYMAGNLENTGYAKEGHACLYNIGNMEETAPVLALGAGAVTKWLFARERRIERAPNLRNIEEYIARVEEMVDRKRALIGGDGK